LFRELFDIIVFSKGFQEVTILQVYKGI
jgi:hypothetical protein